MHDPIFKNLLFFSILKIKFTDHLKIKLKFCLEHNLL